MTPINITLMADGSLFDIESFGQSVCEILPTVYRVDVGKEHYELNEDSNDFLSNYGNATEVTIHLLAFKNEIDIDKLNI